MVWYFNTPLFFRMRILLVLICFSITLLRAEQRGLFQTHETLFPLMDAKGAFEIWCLKDDWIELPEGRLPLVVNYSSAQDDFSNSILGENWWFPLFESSVVRSADDVIDLRMLGGQKRVLHLHADQIYRSNDRDWQGQLDGDAFLVSNKTGWEFHYEGGRLKRATTPEGRRLQWQFSSGIPSGLMLDGRPLVELDTNDNGIVSEMKIYAESGGEKLFQFTDESFPVFGVAFGQEVIVEMRRSVGEIIHNAGRVKIQMDTSGEENLVKIVEENGASFEGNEVLLEKGSGTLLGDMRFDYAWERLPSGGTRATRTLEDGSFESILVDPDKGFQRREFLDGSAVEISQWNVNGKRPSKSIVYFDREGQIVTETRNYFDESGSVVRRIVKDSTGSTEYRFSNASAEEINEILRQGFGLEELESK